MVDRNADAGHELVLDNRKLILVFAVLIVTWGIFFVLGYKTGKEQGYQEGTQVAAESASKNKSENLQAKAVEPGNESAVAKPDSATPEGQQLDWYKNINRRDGEPEAKPKNIPPAKEEKPQAPETPVAKEPAKPAATETAKKPPVVPESKPKAPAIAEPSKPVTYSVQVGAFRVRREVETKAKELQAKNFDCRIESPQTPDQLYLLKVGRFNSRSEAVAMQLRLKKNGFTSFIKTN